VIWLGWGEVRCESYGYGEGNARDKDSALAHAPVHAAQYAINFSSSIKETAYFGPFRYVDHTYCS